MKIGTKRMRNNLTICILYFCIFRKSWPYSYFFLR